MTGITSDDKCKIKQYQVIATIYFN